MSCKANYSYFKLSPVLTIKWTSFQDLKCPNGDYYLILSLILPESSPKILANISVS